MILKKPCAFVNWLKMLFQFKNEKNTKKHYPKPYQTFLKKMFDFVESILLESILGLRFSFESKSKIGNDDSLPQPQPPCFIFTRKISFNPFSALNLRLLN